MYCGVIHWFILCAAVQTAREIIKRGRIAIIGLYAIDDVQNPSCFHFAT